MLGKIIIIMSKSPLKSNTKKVIIRIEIDEQNFYLASIEYNSNVAKVVRLTGDPEKAKKLVRQSTIDQHISAIDKFYSSKIKNLNPKLELLRLNNEYLEAIPEKVKITIQKRLEYYKNLVLWEDDNFDIKKAFAEKDWTKLRKLRTKLTLLFEKEQEYHKMKNFNLNAYSLFKMSVVDAKNEVRAEKLRRIDKI